MYEEILEFRKNILGEEHPDTLDTGFSLALILVQQGKLLKAEDVHRKVLKVRERVLGREHPDTINSIYRLALIRGMQGELLKADFML